MADLYIPYLSINLTNALGHEHRLRPIALRAVVLLSERLGGHAQLFQQVAPALGVDNLRARPIELNLHEHSDEQAAEQIASAWANALTSWRAHSGESQPAKNAVKS